MYPARKHCRERNDERATEIIRGKSSVVTTMVISHPHENMWQKNEDSILIADLYFICPPSQQST